MLAANDGKPGLPDKLGFVEMIEPAAYGLIRHGLRRATFPRGEGFEVAVSWLLYVEKLPRQQLMVEKKGRSVFDEVGFGGVRG